MKRHVNAVDWTDKAAVRAYRAMKTREYYRKHRDSILSKLHNRSDDEKRKAKEYIKAYHIRNRIRTAAMKRERIASMSQEERSLEAAKRLAYFRDYRSRPEVARKRRIQAREYYTKHRKELSALRELYWAGVIDRCEKDAKFYAEIRRRNREYKRIRIERAGRLYSPRLNARIPDWCVMGECCLDRRSVFISGNLTRDQLASNRRFAIRRYVDKFGSNRFDKEFRE